jgi:hypothetical protein
LFDTEAIQYFRNVLDTIQDNPQFPVQKEAAIEGLGDALLINGDLKAALHFEQLSEQTSSNETKLRAVRKAANAYLMGGKSQPCICLNS